MGKETLKNIPSISRIIGSLELSQVISEWGEGYVKFVARKVVDRLRGEAIKKGGLIPNLEEIVNEVRGEVKKFIPSGLRAINCTGILLHTGLGRAPVGGWAKKYLDVASEANLVQMDRSSGGRSLREEFIEEMLRELTGCEAATVLNNNAAATYLMLRVLTKGREVIISRSQLVEIGGSYRMPDIVEESGCKMVEVGTTNKTHLKDYEAKINENTGAILFVHQSNFKIEGFSETPSIVDLCKLGKEKNIPVLADLGSGALVDLAKWGLPSELTVQEVMKAGVSACCFSGDKLLGGPQAGIIVGSKSAIQKIRKDKFSRMFRVCKYTLRGIEGTLLSYLNGDYAETIPLYKLLDESLENLRTRASKILDALGEKARFYSIVEDDAYLGGGSTPGKAIKSIALSYEKQDRDSLGEIVLGLRLKCPAVFPRIEKDKIIFNLRGVSPEEDCLIVEALK